jgi:hypothetical protein
MNEIGRLLGRAHRRSSWESFATRTDSCAVSHGDGALHLGSRGVLRRDLIRGCELRSGWQDLMTRSPKPQRIRAISIFAAGM